MRHDVNLLEARVREKD